MRLVALMLGANPRRQNESEVVIAFTFQQSRYQPTQATSAMRTQLALLQARGRLPSIPPLLGLKRANRSSEGLRKALPK